MAMFVVVLFKTFGVRVLFGSHTMDQLVSVTVGDCAFDAVLELLPQDDRTLDLLNRINGSSFPPKHISFIFYLHEQQ